MQDVLFHHDSGVVAWTSGLFKRLQKSICVHIMHAKNPLAVEDWNEKAEQAASDKIKKLETTISKLPTEII